MGVGSSFGRRVVLFLFVCFSTPKVGDYFVFKSHKWVRFSCFCFAFCVCVLCCFSFKMFNFPLYLGSGWYLFYIFGSPAGKVFCFLLFLFVCFYLILFCFALFFVLLPKLFHPPLISNGAPLSLLLHRWWWTLRHRQFWIPVQFSEKSNSNRKLH